MGFLLRLLPLIAFVFPPALVELALASRADPRSHLPALGLLAAQSLALALAGLLRERRFVAKLQAEPAPPQMQREMNRLALAPGPALHLMPGLEKEVAWARSLRGNGVVLVSRAVLAGQDDQDLVRGIRWAEENLRRPGSAFRSLMAGMSESLERIASPGAASASVGRLVWGVAFLPLIHALRLWAGSAALVWRAEQR